MGGRMLIVDLVGRHSGIWVEGIAMKISTKGDYATRALQDLALHYGEGPIPIEAIAKRQALPARYLEQLLLALKRAGFLTSKRGVNGGYYLAKPPREITLGQIIRAVDGPIAPIFCVSETPREHCSQESFCTLRRSEEHTSELQSPTNLVCRLLLEKK